jgi:type IV secretory pathway VirB2 component (pilin)
LVVIGLLVWLMGILFPMAWASKSNAAWDAWFNRLFAPVWVHVVMHAALYAVLALGLSVLFGKRLSWAGLAGLVLTVAMFQEGLQLLGAGRAPGRGEAFDLLVDACGAALGFGLWRGWQGRRALLKGEVKDEQDVENN